MAITLSNLDGTLEFVAPAGGATAYTPIIESTSLRVAVPLFSAASGANFVGACHNVRVNGVTKSSNTTFLAGAALVYKTDSIVYAATAAGTINAYAAAPATTTSTTVDIVLILPITVT